MKRPALLPLLLALVLVELILLEGFLPYGWPHPLFEHLSRGFVGQVYVPHPHMDLEIEGILRQHPSLRITLYLITVALAVGNAFLISKAWKAWRWSKPVSPQT
jgi:hypothetical protein